MKKLLFLLSFACVANAASAQFFYLNGTSYTQDFNNISTGTPGSPNLPTEWKIYTNATASTLGDVKILTSSSRGTKYPWHNTTGGFKDVASGNIGATADSATQTNATDRALAVRQVGNTNANFPNSDPGAAFVFRVSNTKNLSAFNFEFKLQSLDDTSRRQTEWIFEYALGDNPTSFTAITTAPALLQTGGSVFANTTVTGTLPTAVDNSSVPVYLRIRSSAAAVVVPPYTSGNRATSAIDDFKLTWTGNATSVNDVASGDVKFSVSSATSSKIVLNMDLAKAGKYNMAVYDAIGKKIYSNTVNAVKGSQTYTVDNVDLPKGLYIIKVGNGDAQQVVKTIIQ